MKVTNLIIAVLIAGTMASSVSAQTGISYPVAELGNCTDKVACKVYCDKQTNIDACLAFAEKNNLMSKDEIKKAKNFKKTGMTGPGGCKGKDECKTYCSNSDHMDECVTFAEKNGLMSDEQLDEAKKVRGAISRGIKPPACGGKETCDAYCSSSEHIEECVKFGEAAGMISKEDAEKIRKGGGKGPGGPGDSGSPDDGGKRGPGDDKRGPDGPSGDGGNGKGEKDKGGPGQNGGKASGKQRGPSNKDPRDGGNGGGGQGDPGPEDGGQNPGDDSD